MRRLWHNRIIETTETKMLNITHRLHAFIKATNHTVSVFEERIAVAPNSIQRAINNKTSVSSSILVKIVKAYPEINMNWLLIGNGEMFMQATKPFDSEKMIGIDRATPFIQNEFVELQRKLIICMEENRILKESTPTLKTTTY
jgi:plasmid maintenance system antidote protein VapI